MPEDDNCREDCIKVATLCRHSRNGLAWYKAKSPPGSLLGCQAENTLGARGFSCAVSGVGHAFDRRSEANYFRISVRRARETSSGIQGKQRTVKNSVILITLNCNNCVTYRIARRKIENKLKIINIINIPVPHKLKVLIVNLERQRKQNK